MLKFPKPTPRLLKKRQAKALTKREWRALHQIVAERDGKHCRNCKTERGLDLHHVIFRSLGGKDVAENLILLCQRCHQDVHGHLLKLRWRDDRQPAKTVRFERVA